MAIKITCSHCEAVLTLAVIDGAVEIIETEPPAQVKPDPNTGDDDNLVRKLIGGKDGKESQG